MQFEEMGNLSGKTLIYKCDHGRMDQRRKYMDVPGAFAHEEKRKTCIGPMKKG